jgi:DNA-binding MarR family transcriptional regulator
VSAPPVDQLAIDLLVLSARFARLASRESTSTMPRALWRTLAQLDELGPLRVSELAAASHVSQPTATSLLQRLGDRGWVERRADPDDARAVRVRISRAGRRALARNRQVAAEAVRGRLERLAEVDRQALAAGLAALRLVLADPPTEPPDDPSADETQRTARTAPTLETV